MAHYRILAALLTALCLMAASGARGSIGIEPIPDQDIPSGKTLVVPIAAADPDGPYRSYTVAVGAPTTNGVVTTAAGINAVVRTGDPHLILGVSYTDSNSILQTGTMEFQLLREFAPLTTQIVSGLAEGGFYNPQYNVAQGINYTTFYRVISGFLIQGGDPTGTGSGGPGFAFENEFSNALVYSGTAGQLGMANAGTDYNGGTNGSQFFITLGNDRYVDYGYTLFGQMLRGYDTLFGIAGTPVQDNEYGEISSPINPVNFTSAGIVQNRADAVLLLSATGVCDAVVTVVASSGTSSTVQTFVAHAVADSFSDPPFLQPVPDTAAHDGEFNTTLEATDLQLDLMQYSYQCLLPFTGPIVDTGTSPQISIPLVSNTGNTMVAMVNILDHGNDFRVFNVAAGDKTLHGSLAPMALGFNSELTLGTSLARFDTANLKDTAASFTASVNYGDGTYLSGTAGISIVKVPAPAGVAAFRLNTVAPHTYTMPGEYPVIVKISDNGGASLTLTGTTNVSASLIAMEGGNLASANGRIADKVLATFQDFGSASIAADYSAVVDWGDGTVTPGVVKVKNARDFSYHILGSHTYQTTGPYTVSVSVSRGGATASEWSGAQIEVPKSPQIFPPFPQAHLAQIWSGITTDTETVILSGSDDGANPYGGLIQGPDGDFYGTTANAGAHGTGTIFKITSGGVLTKLHAFGALVNGTNADGANPYSALITGTDGNLYGTAFDGGAYGVGTIFKISPNGSFATLYSFNYFDGAFPYAPLAVGTDGNLYGTTTTGGDYDNGTIFQINDLGSFNTLYSFGGGYDGGSPYAGLVTGTDGKLYGEISTGGLDHCGMVFYLTYDGRYGLVYYFTGGAGGSTPYASLITGTDGYLYGTTKTGGDYDAGTIFRLSYSGSLNTIYSFSSFSDGGDPYAALTVGTDGNLYGTTSDGGPYNLGTVFRLTYDGSFKTFYPFQRIEDGGSPYGALITGSDGNLYGTTELSGSNGAGTVFQLTYGGVLTTLNSFTTTDVTTFEYALRSSVTIVNSGNRDSAPGSFSAYVDPNGELDGLQTECTIGGSSSLPIPPLRPGQSVSLLFEPATPAGDLRLKLPAGFAPTGQWIMGVVNYSDPVGDFDGSAKIVLPATF